MKTIIKSKLSAFGALVSLALLSNTAHAQKVTVTVQNLTHGSHFTPLLVGAHSASIHLFKAGAVASASLQAMAEGGSIAGLVGDLGSANATVVENPAGGLLAPGASTTTTVLNTDGASNNYLSVVAMVLPSNDGFMGLNSWPIPTIAGTYTVNVNAYDAGTEANNELLGVATAGMPGVLGIPGAPSGSAGTGGTGASAVDNNTTVHIHRGVLGDTNAAGGISDLDSRVHRWLNPVARVTITVAK
jgi:hypothetical protein